MKLNKNCIMATQFLLELLTNFREMLTRMWLQHWISKLGDDDEILPVYFIGFAKNFKGKNVFNDL